MGVGNDWFQYTKGRRENFQCTHDSRPRNAGSPQVHVWAKESEKETTRYIRGTDLMCFKGEVDIWRKRRRKIAQFLDLQSVPFFLDSSNGNGRRDRKGRVELVVSSVSLADVILMMTMMISEASIK